jgi:hypothetical protein
LFECRLGLALHGIEHHVKQVGRNRALGIDLARGAGAMQPHRIDLDVAQLAPGAQHGVHAALDVGPAAGRRTFPERRVARLAGSGKPRAAVGTGTDRI